MITHYTGVLFGRFERSDHVISHVNSKKKLVTHFFAKEVSNESYSQIERDTLKAAEWGVEVRFTHLLTKIE